MLNQAVIKGRQLNLMEADITDLSVDAIVNPANSDLFLGSGVAGAIRRRGGPSIQEECDALGGCQTGRAVITSAGKLPARKIIHAVGPKVGNPDGDDLLYGATISSLLLAEEYQLATIAFPAISTGVYGYPIHDCARLMLEAVLWFLDHEANHLVEVIICLYDQASYEAFARELKKQVPD